MPLERNRICLETMLAFGPSRARVRISWNLDAENASRVARISAAPPFDTCAESRPAAAERALAASRSVISRIWGVGWLAGRGRRHDREGPRSSATPLTTARASAPGRLRTQSHARKPVRNRVIICPRRVWRLRRRGSIQSRVQGKYRCGSRPDEGPRGHMRRRNCRFHPAIETSSPRRRRPARPAYSNPAGTGHDRLRVFLVE